MARALSTNLFSCYVLGGVSRSAAMVVLSSSAGLSDDDRRVRRLAYAVADGLPISESPPEEFRIFREGLNATTKGDLIFDADAADRVMRAYEHHGVDFMIDLEHTALSDAALRARNDAADAMGWAHLEMRHGELWAVNVRWTPEGADRIKKKKQRYISPAFVTLGDDGEGIDYLINAALCSLPATHGAAPLVAASNRPHMMALATKGVPKMPPDIVAKMLEALKKQDAKAALALLEELIAANAGAIEEPPKADGDEAMGAPPSGEKEELADDPPKGDDEKKKEELAEDPPKDEEDKKELSLLADVCALTGRSSAGGAMLALREWRDSYVAQRSRAIALDRSERAELVGALVKLGVELPATAWEGEGDDRRPVARLRSEPIKELRSRVEMLSSVRGASGIQPPIGGAIDKLTDGERAAVVGMSDVQKAQFLALRSLRSRN